MKEHCLLKLEPKVCTHRSANIECKSGYLIDTLFSLRQEARWAPETGIHAAIHTHDIYARFRRLFLLFMIREKRIHAHTYTHEKRKNK